MKRQRRSGKKVWITLFLLLVAGTYCGFALTRPLPDLKPTQTNTTISVKPAASTLQWPAAQAAVGILGSDDIETHGTQSPAPTASTAKVITALTVLSKKPLKAGEQGPIVTLTANDVALYQIETTREGSAVPVVAGEQISEYQMLQAMMLPSANNISNSLALWAFGSQDAYAAAANAYLTAHNITNTHIGTDASGLSPDTTSTASDLVKIGKLAMQTPVLAEIVGQTTATGIPQTTSVSNVNYLLGQNNIIGIKTGNSDQAGGVFISASKIMVNNKPVTIITAIAGSATLSSVLRESQTLVKSAQNNFAHVSLVKKTGDPIGRYDLPWGGSVIAVAAQDLGLTNWNNSTTTAQVSLSDITANTPTGQAIGSITVAKSALNDRQSVQVMLQGSISKPSLWWRLVHPLL